MNLGRWLTLGLVLATASCSWTRFDDVAQGAPILLLKESEDMRSGFGSSLATTSVGDLVQLMAAGSPGGKGAAIYNLGTGDQPILDAVDTKHCATNNDPCFLGRGVAALGRAMRRGSSDEMQLCFVAGLGSTGQYSPGLLARCDDNNLEYTLDLPEGSVRDTVDFAVATDQSEVVVLGADKDEAPAVIAGLPSEQAAWFYPPLSHQPLELIPPATPVDESYASTVAVARVGGLRLLAVGAPEQGHVWLFRADPDTGVTAVGCLGGPSGFGRTLASGPVTEDTDDELIVADDVNVHVFDGSCLNELAPAASSDCSLAALPAGALIASFGCGATPDVSGCPSSQFGAAVDVGDLDGDDDGEVIVGAPRLKVRGEPRAGAVLVYDVEGQAKHELAEVKFISSAESGDLLGSAIATPRIEDRHIIAAGAPGNGKVALFYCNDLLPPERTTDRCR